MSGSGSRSRSRDPVSDRFTEAGAVLEQLHGCNIPGARLRSSGHDLDSTVHSIARVSPSHVLVDGHGGLARVKGAAESRSSTGLPREKQEGQVLGIDDLMEWDAPDEEHRSESLRPAGSEESMAARRPDGSATRRTMADLFEFS